VIRASLAAAGIAAVLLVAPLATGADAPSRFTATIAPSTVQPPGLGPYTIAITNQPNSAEATSASIDIPPGFAVDGVVSPPTVSVSAPCADRTWTASLGVSAINLAPATSGDALCERGTLTVNFNVIVAPLTDGQSTWTTSVAPEFAVSGTQPMLTIDGTPPDTAIAGTPPLFTDTTASFGFTGSDGGAPPSGIASFECSLDGVAFSPCASPASYGGLSDGGHTFAVRAIDVAGNVDPTPDSWSWTVDAGAPDTSIDGAPPNLSASRTATFGFSGTDSGSGVAGFECNLDGGGFSPCSNGITYTGLADGTHTFAVRAVDTVGNRDASPATGTWEIDATPPPAPIITSAPSDPSGDSSWTFQYTDGDPTAHLLCQLDGGAFTGCPSGFTTPPLPDGRHTFGVKAVDDAGNASGVTTYTWTIDTVHPLVSITSAPPLLTNQTNASFSFVANKPGSTYRCALDGGAFGSCSSPRLYNNLSNGSHTFAVRGVWLALVGPPTEYTWRVDTVPPQTTITSTPPADSRSRTATFAFTSGEANSTFTCRLNSAGFTPCTSPHAYTGLGDGTYTFRAQAVDAAGNADTTPALYTWRISGVGPPTADLRPPANVGKVRRNVGYGRLQLRWRKPADGDFDHVNVYVSTSRKTPPRRLVYTGKRLSYTDRRFKNGQYYRFLVVSYDRAKNASGGRSVLVPPSALLRSPRNGSTVRGVPKFRWAAVRGASFYNMQLYRKGQKILSAWPGKARQSLTRQWSYAGHRYALRRGLYVWYVWPGFGPRAKSRYGQLLGQGTFRVR
jgi:hypothetical protein